MNPHKGTLVTEYPRNNTLHFQDNPETLQRLLDATEQSLKNGHYMNFVTKLQYLARYATTRGTISQAVLFADFDNGFCVEMQIFHSSHEGVRMHIPWRGGLNYHEKLGWSINT